MYRPNLNKNSPPFAEVNQDYRLCITEVTSLSRCRETYTLG